MSIPIPRRSTAARIASTLALLLAAGSALARAGTEGRHTLSLAGTWRVALDSQAVGEAERWFAADLAGEPIELPGTTDLAGIGYPLDHESMTYGTTLVYTQWPSGKPVVRADEGGTLVRERYFVGKAWYQRTVEIPPAWAGMRAELRLERVLWQSRVWIDERYAGARDSLVAEHRHDLGRLDAGPHRITICVDNSLIHNIGTIGHAYGPETQSIWNGIVGALELIPVSPVRIAAVRVFPASDRRSVRAELTIDNDAGRDVDADLHLAVQDEAGGADLGSSVCRLAIRGGVTVATCGVSTDGPLAAWDEFSPLRYRLVASLAGAGNAGSDEISVPFGFREIRREGRSITVNGRPVFLRGTLDCCVYPRTGHPPMTLDAWMRVMSIIKEHGFNHVRFHTWCPPGAAFEAADRLGLYLMPETPFWVDDWSTNTGSRPSLLGQDPDVLDYVRREMRRIVEAYGNHPSFALFGIGNEFGSSGDWALVDQLVAEAKAHDPRRLYTGTTARRTVASDDYWVTHATEKAAARGIGPASTDWDFSAAVDSADLPLIAHETGQRPVFPDYAKLLPKFTGPLKPYNLERYRAQLEGSGMASQVEQFARASALFQDVQYKAEHEAMRRTPGLAGYQLLMLNDFTGQSEALVGVLDPFWETKGIVSSADVRAWNTPTVPLARFERYVWTRDETFRAALALAHHGPADLPAAPLRWSLARTDSRTLAAGILGPSPAPTGKVTPFGEIHVPLDAATEPATLTLQAEIAGAVNRWRLWVYPPAAESAEPHGVLVTSQWDVAREALAAGGAVLFVGHGRNGDFAATTPFSSVYWSAGWWGNAFSSLGILCDPAHPALASFPNAGHSDWQWSELTDNATTFLLADAPAGYRPIVQAVPDFHYNRLLAQLCEMRVGPGRLLLCGYDLTSNLERRHAARQLRRSLLDYAASGAFRPAHEWSADAIARLLSEPSTRPSM